MGKERNNRGEKEKLSGRTWVGKEKNNKGEEGALRKNMRGKGEK